MDLEGKKLLILGGVALAKEIVKCAQARNIKALVTDYLVDSPAKKIADERFMVSTTNVDAVVELIKKQKIDGVITGFVDSLLPYYAAICEKANLPCYGTKEQFELAMSKDKFKQLCRDFDVPTVIEYDLKYPFNDEELKNIQYPIVIKPVDNSGARGVYICENEFALKNNYPRTLSFSKSKKVIVEKYMSNNEVTINYIVQDGNVVLSSVSDRYMKNKGKNTVSLPVAYIYPSVHLAKYQKTLNQKVIKMLKSVGIRNGVIFIQTFEENGNCVLYEMGYRMTGAMDFKITNKINGINPMDLMINFALTGKMAAQNIANYINPNYQEFGFSLTFCAKPGRIAKIINLDKVLEIDDVLDIVLSYQEGDVIEETAIGTLKQVVMRVFGVCKTRTKMLATIKAITSLIDVVNSSYESLLLEQFDANDL